MQDLTFLPHRLINIDGIVCLPVAYTNSRRITHSLRPSSGLRSRNSHASHITQRPIAVDHHRRPYLNRNGTAPPPTHDVISTYASSRPNLQRAHTTPPAAVGNSAPTQTAAIDLTSDDEEHHARGNHDRYVHGHAQQRVPNIIQAPMSAGYQRRPHVNRHDTAHASSSRPNLQRAHTSPPAAAGSSAPPQTAAIDLTRDDEEHHAPVYNARYVHRHAQLPQQYLQMNRQRVRNIGHRRPIHLHGHDTATRSAAPPPSTKAVMALTQENAAPAASTSSRANLQHAHTAPQMQRAAASVEMVSTENAHDCIDAENHSAAPAISLNINTAVSNVSKTSAKRRFISLFPLGFKRIGLVYAKRNNKSIFFSFWPKTRIAQHVAHQMDRKTCCGLTLTQQMILIQEEIGYLPLYIDPDAVMQVWIEFKRDVVASSLIRCFVQKYNSLIEGEAFQDVPKQTGSGMRQVSNVNDTVEEHPVQPQIEVIEPDTSSTDLVPRKQYIYMLNDKNKKHRVLQAELQNVSDSHALQQKIIDRTQKELKKMQKQSCQDAQSIEKGLKTLPVKTQSNIVYTLAKRRHEVTARLSANADERKVKRQNKEIMTEKYSDDNVIRFAVGCIERNFSYGDIQAVREILCCKPEVCDINGQVGVHQVSSSFWGNGIIKDAWYKRKDFNFAIDRWYIYHPEFEVDDRLLIVDAPFGALREPAKAIKSLAEVQLTSQQLEDKHAVNVRRLVKEPDLKDEDEIDVPIIGLVRVDATGMPNCTQNSCTIVTFQLFGYLSWWANVLLGFLIVAVFACSDDNIQFVKAIQLYFDNLCNELRLYGAHVISFAHKVINFMVHQITLLWMFDGKGFNAACKHMPPQSNFFEPLCTKLVRKENAAYLQDFADERERELLQKTIRCGFVLESISNSEMDIIHTFAELWPWEVPSYLEAHKDDVKHQTIFVMPCSDFLIDMIKSKLAVVEYRKERDIETFASYTVKEQVSWRKDQAQLLNIGFYDVFMKEVLLTPLPANCHGLIRCVADTVLKKLTLQRRIDRHTPVSEIEVIGSDPQLQTVCSDLQKLCNQLPLDDAIKLMMTGKHAKKLSFLVGEICEKTDEEIDSSNREWKLQHKRNISALFAVESSCIMMQFVASDNKDKEWNDPILLDKCKEGMRRFRTLMELEPLLFTPSMFRFLVLAVRCLVVFQYRINRQSKIKFKFPFDADQGTESANKRAKMYQRKTSNNKSSALPRLVRHLNFYSIASLIYNLKSWHKTESDMERDHQKWYCQPYDVTRFDSWAIQLMEAARQYNVTDVLASIHIVTPTLSQQLDAISEWEVQQYQIVNVVEPAPLPEHTQNDDKKRKRKPKSGGYKARKKKKPNVDREFIDDDDDDDDDCMYE